MHLNELLRAFEEYMQAKKESDAQAIAPCDDWDCGLASELSTTIRSAEQEHRLQQAKSALASALDRYIDSRVDALLREKAGS